MFGWLRREATQLGEKRNRILEALRDYPIYEPLHRQGPNCPRNWRSSEVQEFAARGRENFAHFAGQRHVRLTALGTFFAKFDVRLNSDDKGFADVSKWLPGNTGVLAADLRRDETMQLFFQHSARWDGRWRGLNVIFDLGVFLGECITTRNSRLHWAYFPGTSEDGSAAGSGYRIEGFRLRRDWFDPMSYMLYLCGADEADLYNGQVGRSVKEDRLVGAVRDFSTR